MPDRTQESATSRKRRFPKERRAAETGTNVETVRETPAQVHAVRGPGALKHMGSGASVNIGGTERLVSVAGGGLLALYGLRRRSWFAGLPLLGIGAALLYRGGTGRSKIYRRFGVEQPDGSVKLMQAVTVNRAIEDVYAFWRRLENLPTFMHHIRSVEQLSTTRSHWVARAPGLQRAVEWNSDLVEDKPNEIIRWQSVPNGSIQHNGEVRFKRAPGNRGTEVHVRLEYRPPMGTAVAALTYPFNKQTMQEEIRRLKRVLETGEIPTTAGQPAGGAR